MAGGSVGPQQTGRRRNLDAEINLVPFIDLLSMCICFLLMTAIWIEIGSIQVKQMLGTNAPAMTTEAIDLEVRMRADQGMELVIQKAGKTVQAYQIEGSDFEQKLSQLNNYVTTIMMSLSQDPNSSITGRVIPAQIFNYGNLVSVLDVMRGNGVSQLAVVPVKE